MVVNRNGFFDDLEPLAGKELRKHGGISFQSKKQRLEVELARIEEREEKIALSKAKKQADLQLLDDEADDFRVKISMEDFEILRRAKLQQHANPAFVPAVQASEHPNIIGNIEDHAFPS